MTDELLNTAKVADLYGLAETTLRKWRMIGRGPRFVRLGRTVRYRRADLEAFTGERAFRTTGEADAAEAG